MANPPGLSDEVKARIRAEEEARLQARLEERYRQEVRAELEADLAAEQATTDVDRPPLSPSATAPKEASARSGRADNVRILPKVDPATAPHDTDVDAPPRVARGDVAPVAEQVAEEVVARVRRSRLWWLGWALLVAGGTATLAGVLLSGGEAADDAGAATEVIELTGDGALAASEPMADDAAELAGEAWMLRDDGRIVVEPRPPLMSREALLRELGEPAKAPRWPIPDNPPLEILLREELPIQGEPGEPATP